MQIQTQLGGGMGWKSKNLISSRLCLSHQFNQNRQKNKHSPKRVTNTKCAVMQIQKCKGKWDENNSIVGSKPQWSTSPSCGQLPFVMPSTHYRSKQSKKWIENKTINNRIFLLYLPAPFPKWNPWNTLQSIDHWQYASSTTISKKLEKLYCLYFPNFHQSGRSRERLQIQVSPSRRTQ